MGADKKAGHLSVFQHQHSCRSPFAVQSSSAKVKKAFFHFILDMDLPFEKTPESWVFCSLSYPGFWVINSPPTAGCATCSSHVPAFMHMALPILTLSNVCVAPKQQLYTMCYFSSVEVEILAAPRAKGWGMILVFPMDGDQRPRSVPLWLLPKLQLCTSALPHLWCPPGSCRSLQPCTAGAGFKRARVLLSSSATPDFFLPMFKSWISFEHTRNWFRLISCKSQQHAGLNAQRKPI